MRILARTALAVQRRLFAMGVHLKPPEAVRGLTEISDKDRELFRLDVSFPCIPIHKHDIGRVRGVKSIQKFLVHGITTIKPVMPDPENQSAEHKLYVFEPFEDDEKKREVKEAIERVVQSTNRIEFTQREWSVGWEDWDTHRLVKAVLPEDLDFSSFTQTGHIVHCNFKDETLPYRKAIGRILLEKVKNCRTVIMKSGKIENEYRFFDLEVLAGEKDFVTELTECGVRFKLDFSKVYWNSRLSHEHSRVVDLMDAGAIVYDACAGVGPFVLPVLKRPGKKILRAFANDLNPESVRWLEVNRKLNKLDSAPLSVYNKDAVEFLRDVVAEDLAREMTAESSSTSAAHILMNLPAYAVNFLPALKGLLAGRTLPDPLPFPVFVYCYLFTKAKEVVPDSWYVDEAKRLVGEQIPLEELVVRDIHHVRTVSNLKEMFCVLLELPRAFLLTVGVTNGEPAPKRQKIG